MNIKAVKERAMSIDTSKSLLDGLVDKSVQHRCSVCNSIIAVGSVKGVWEIRCRRCGFFNKQGSA